MLLDEHAIRPVGVEAGPPQDPDPVNRRRPRRGHPDDPADEAVAPDVDRNVGDGPCPDGGNAGLARQVPGDRRRVTARDREVGEGEVVVQPLVRRCQVLERVVGGPEQGDPEQHRDADGQELRPPAGEVPAERAAKEPHQLTSSGTCGSLTW